MNAARAQTSAPRAWRVGRLLGRSPRGLWLMLAGALLGPWLLGGYLAYAMLVLRFFGVELAPAR